jgi:hypothetical protein
LASKKGRPDSNPLKRHHIVHFGANAYPFSELVVVVAGDMGQHFFAGSQAQGVYGRA